MSSTLRTSPSFRSQRLLAARPHQNRGMVLIIVLTCLALLAILIVSFMSGATSELAASRQFAASAETQNLASSALNLAMGQVAAATKADSNSVSWASQPGMIRNYDTTSTDSVALYKLYSTSNMTVTGPAAANFPPGSDLDAAWDTKPVLYTDLNPPIERDGELRFPIVDPRAAAGANPVAGFSYSAGINGVKMGNSATVPDDDARLPMPVEWLYVLRDGSFAAATSSDGKTATVPDASKTNPIVGRVAFWTDDESCKVNVNTASEGGYWDVPTTNFAADVALDSSFPVKNEFQRYPGHPSTTSLSAVFPNLVGPTLPTNEAFHKLTPRIEFGGSKEGTVKANQNPQPITPDAHRLYDSVDELMMDENRNLLSSSVDLRSRISSQQIERARFFLTAHSRAPELTLFNTPRVAVWPLHQNKDARHSSEKLIAFAASGNSSTPNHQDEYFFTRAYQFDPMADLDDSPRVGRNKAILAYLQRLTSMPIPGVDGSFLTKWGAAERDQILFQIYDYIRSCINLRTRVMNGGITTSTNQGIVYTGASQNDTLRGRKGVVFPSALSTGSHGNGFSTAGDVRGFGRFPIVREVSLVFGASQNLTQSGAVVTQPCKIWPAVLVSVFLPSPGNKRSSHNIKVTVAGLNSFRWRVKTSAAGPLEELPMFDTNTKVFFADVNHPDHPGARGYADAAIGVPILHIRHVNTSWGPTGLHKPDDPSGPQVENWDPEGVEFLGGNMSITVDLAETNLNPFSPSTPPAVLEGAPSNAIKQNYTINFPPPVNASGNKWRNPQVSTTSLPTMLGRITVPAMGQWIRIVDTTPDHDLVKSMVAGAGSGDYRLIATKNVVPSSDFVPAVGYDDRTAQAHSLLVGGTTLANNANLGSLIPGVSWTKYHTASAVQTMAPILPSGAVAGLSGGAVQGDWDNGVGYSMDGSFINKADEGIDYLLGGTGYGGQFSYLEQTKSEQAPLEQNFGPMRQIASPVMLGSLPTGAKRNLPWQTLLFCANPAGGSIHPGFDDPRDYYLLDLFWMPVTEPYAISDKFSTAGKVNLNYQMLPFTYINRETGLHALLKNERVIAFPEDLQSGTFAYKRHAFAPSTSPPMPGVSRYPINIDQTLEQFRQKFQLGRVFSSATEICSLFLVPDETGVSLGNIDSFWNTHRLTGDNMRERPYNAIYPRVTTQSNVYTVYVKAQSVKQVPSTLNSGGKTFTEGKDIVQGEFQGSYTLERYIDPSANLPGDDTDPLGSLYKLRVINQRHLNY